MTLRYTRVEELGVILSVVLNSSYALKGGFLLLVCFLNDAAWAL